MNKLICIAGMCGSGKSEVSNFFVDRGFSYVRFGQITLDEIQKRGLEVSEDNERKFREDFRKEHGQGAYAILNIPKFDEALKNSNTIGDGLYSWSEYKVLKEKYGDNFIVIAVYASPSTRYSRLERRAERHENDKENRFRSISKEKAQSRDYADIENIEKAGPIAMADFTVVNEGTLEDLKNNLENIYNKIF
ncbi:MAG TPA: AAA family ATPase [bacterium]|jgi:dephospho-CoA kinase|nr:AAA family ATPase [bacterium]HOG38772.1 AAA family ATPase [bacterium]HQI03609.1 AAA family ATPase [bacterium]